VARLENGGLVAGWLEVGRLEERLQVSAHDLHLADKVGVAAAAVCEGAHGRLTAVYLHLCEKVVFSGLFDMSFFSWREGIEMSRKARVGCLRCFY
jgi:hypothetical protein